MAEDRLSNKQVSAASARVIIVVNGETYASRLADAFRRHSHTVTVVGATELGATLTNAGSLDAILWRVRRNDDAALIALRDMRRRRVGLPLVMQISDGSQEDGCAFLAAGADVCLLGPSDELLVVVQVEALIRCLRRQRSVVVFDSYALVRDHHSMERPDSTPIKRVHFSEQEYLIVELLAACAGESVAHSRIDSVVWGRDMSGDESARYRLVGKVRKKLDDLGGISVSSDHGVGYRLALVREVKGSQSGAW